MRRRACLASSESDRASRAPRARGPSASRSPWSPSSPSIFAACALDLDGLAANASGAADDEQWRRDCPSSLTAQPFAVAGRLQHRRERRSDFARRRPRARSTALLPVAARRRALDVTRSDSADAACSFAIAATIASFSRACRRRPRRRSPASSVQPWRAIAASVDARRRRLDSWSPQRERRGAATQPRRRRERGERGRAADATGNDGRCDDLRAGSRQAAQAVRPHRTAVRRPHRHAVSGDGTGRPTRRGDARPDGPAAGRRGTMCHARSP